MRLKGEFRIRNVTRNEPWTVVPNEIFDEGQDAYLKILFQGDDTIVPIAGDYFLGLAGNLVTDPSSTLSDITDEVPVANGYARQPVARSGAGWPTVEAVDPYYRAVSDVVSWTAAGGDFGATFTRLFLTNVVSGTAGLLFAFSAPLASPKLIIDTETYEAQYSAYIL